MTGAVVPPANDLLSMRQTYEVAPSLDQREWQYVQSSGTDVVIWPRTFPTRLFRGQSQRYSPSYSFLSRGLEAGHRNLSSLSLLDQARVLDRITRRLWFIREMEHHPASKWLKSQGLARFDMALAQHYGIPTGYMDLTESFDVACFFATSRLVESSGWQPCFKGVGVIYCLPTNRIPIRPDALQPIGLQVFPRPREQWGWVVVAGIGEDFEELPGLQMFEFEHDRSVSQYFFDKFNGGADLFPPDEIADIADQIMTSKTLPHDLLNRAVIDVCADARGFSAPASDIVNALDTVLGIRGETYGQLLNSETVTTLTELWKNREDFFKNVGFQVVRTRNP